eukprot:GGOE01003827.1.p1 GENE.GGOE01003827.1~~GGOE01003827.1.p1  ORF type:complete len:463 (-),score=117.52 GGOE01003827.1:397-1785(-)
MAEGEPLTHPHGGPSANPPADRGDWWRQHRNRLLVASIMAVYIAGLGIGCAATAGAVWLQYKEDAATALGQLDIVVAFLYWFAVQCYWLPGLRSFALSVQKARPIAPNPTTPTVYGTACGSPLPMFEEDFEVGESVYTKLGRLQSFIMVGIVQLCAIISRLSQNCFFFAHSSDEHADARLIYLQLLCACIAHLGCLQVSLWMIQESHETANLIQRKLQVPVHQLLQTLPEVRQLNARHAAQFQFAFTSLCFSACISAVWTTRNFIMSADASGLCTLYLLFPSFIDGLFCFIVAVNCALPNTQMSELRQRLCLEYQCPGWTTADEQAWPVVRQRLKGLIHKGYEGIHVFGQVLTLGTLTNIVVGVASVFGALIGLLSYVASRSPAPGLNSCQSIPECTAGGWRHIVPICLLMAGLVLVTELVAMRVVRGTLKRRMGVPKGLHHGGAAPMLTAPAPFGLLGSTA